MIGENNFMTRHSFEDYYKSARETNLQYAITYSVQDPYFPSITLDYS